MKDLYRWLGVPPTATEEEIRAALGKTDASTRVAAEFILLNAARRPVYDRNHRLLSAVGHLRARLALGLRPFWSHAHHQDFNQRLVQRTPAGFDVESVINRAGHRNGGRGRWVFVWVAVVALGVIGVCAWWMLRH